MSFLRESDAIYDTWLKNFVDTIPTLVGKLGVDATLVTETVTSLNDTHEKYTIAVAKEAEANAALKAKNIQRKDSEKKARQLIRQIKASKSYSEDIGKLLQIINTNDKPNYEDAKPVITPKASGNKIAIKFVKNKMTGIRLYCRRANETDFSLLAMQHKSPYNDTRKNVIANQPEERQYKAIYFLNDEEVGQMSDIISITV